jgi:NhaA family Na+:H+ antiporter
MAQSPIDLSPLTWLGGDRRLARRIGRPVRRFLRVEAAGGILLIVATVVALAWANSPWSDGYFSLIHTEITLKFGDLLTISEDFEHWVNDALMVLFFFVVGIEINRELVTGELRDRRAAALPAIAAVGGMVVPALVYALINFGGEGAHGWGVPMATDIAFAVGVVSLLGNRVPGAMKVFLLTLAIVDDIGAILVIAVFYTDQLSLGWLAIAGVTVVVVIVMRAVRIWYIPVYVVVGSFLWLAVFESGVHATIAGVVLGLIAPARPLKDLDEHPPLDVHLGSAIGGQPNAGLIRRAHFEIRETVSVAERLDDVLHPFTSFLIVPLFAFANAGIKVSGETISEAATSPVTLGVVFGLVVGKLVGISLFTYLGVKLGIARMPRGATWTHVVGLSAVAGIGFTVALFISNLAFTDPVLVEDAKIGILAASVVAALVGVIILMRASKVVELEMEPAERDS